MKPHSADQSVECLDVLRDPQADQVEKEAAFALMMSLPMGWWGRRGLYDFAVACAFACARYKLTPHNISVDRIDFESLANEALMVLYYKANEISESPRGWLAGVIKNLVKSEIRRRWAELTAEQVPDDLLAPDELREGETASLALDDRVLDAIRRLTPALRAVAELHFIHQVPRHELATYLELSEETLRKRLTRVREALRAALVDVRDEARQSQR